MKNTALNQTHTHNNLNLNEHDHHDHTFTEEVVHHFPYAIFSIAFGMIILSLLDYNTVLNSLSNLGNLAGTARQSCNTGFNMLFHSFHFLHILFASTGAVITFSRFSNNVFKMILVGTISPAFFCVLSDVLLPYAGGTLMGLHMDLHICFHEELHNVLPFLFIGVLNGYLLRVYGESMLRAFSFGSHFAHILISSLASLFYMVSHGFTNWYPHMGVLFLFLIVAIVIPCTLSDVIIPMYFARQGAKKA